MKKIILIAIGLFSYSIGSANLNDAFSKYFNKKDQTELMKVLDSFDNFVKTRYGGSNIQESYANFFKKFYDDKNIDIEQLVIFNKRCSMLKDLPAKTYNKVWNKDSCCSPTIHRTDGNYVKFLDEIGKENPFWKDYALSIETAGGINPSAHGYLSFEAENGRLDFNDKVLRLMIMIHFISE